MDSSVLRSAPSAATVSVPHPTNDAGGRCPGQTYWTDPASANQEAASSQAPRRQACEPLHVDLLTRLPHPSGADRSAPLGARTQLRDRRLPARRHQLCRRRVTATLACAARASCRHARTHARARAHARAVYRCFRRRHGLRQCARPSPSAHASWPTRRSLSMPVCMCARPCACARVLFACARVRAPALSSVSVRARARARACEGSVSECVCLRARGACARARTRAFRRCDRSSLIPLLLMTRADINRVGRL
jgi:hypothetical protein